MQFSAVALRPPDFFRLFEDEAFIMPPPPLPRKHLESESPSGSTAGTALGQPIGASASFVLPLSHFGVEQLYEEACFDPAAAVGARVTPKSELKRLSAELRSQVQMVALALAEEALGLGGSGKVKAGLSGPAGAEAPSSAVAGTAAVSGKPAGSAMAVEGDAEEQVPVGAGGGAGGGSTLTSSSGSSSGRGGDGDSTSASKQKQPESSELAQRCQLLQINMMHLLARLREFEALARLEAASATAAWVDAKAPAANGGNMAAVRGGVQQPAANGAAGMGSEDDEL